jgi:dnd system-associated protein 4
MIAKRAGIFEELANGGLSILAEETRGQVDLSQAILLMVGDTRRRDELDTPTFDLSKLRI